MYTLLYLKWVTNKDLLYSAGNAAQCYLAGLDGSGLWGRVDAGTCTAELFRSSPQNITMLLIVSAAAAAKPLQPCPTLCDLLDGSPPGSTTPGILQARTLEWVAISFSNAWKWKVKVKSLSRVWLFTTPWNCSPPGSAVPGILQASIPEWGAIAFSVLIAYTSRQNKVFLKRY